MAMFSRDYLRDPIALGETILELREKHPKGRLTDLIDRNWRLLDGVRPFSTNRMSSDPLEHHSRTRQDVQLESEPA